MTMEKQQQVIKGLASSISKLSEEFVAGVANHILTGVDSILSDMEMSNIEKIGSIKVVMDVGWSTMTAVTHRDPDITIQEMASEEPKK